MVCFFFFNDTATTEIYTLSLHDALPILTLRTREVPLHKRPERLRVATGHQRHQGIVGRAIARTLGARTRERNDFGRDRKSTRLNSSHANISYAVFCLKKKNKIKKSTFH